MIRAYPACFFLILNLVLISSARFLSLFVESGMCKVITMSSHVRASLLKTGNNRIDIS